MLEQFKILLSDKLTRFFHGDVIDVPLEQLYEYFERRMNKMIYVSGSFMQLKPESILWVIMYNILLAVVPFLVYILAVMTVIKINLELPSLIFLGHYLCLVFISGMEHIHVTLNRGEGVYYGTILAEWEKLNRYYYSETNLRTNLKKFFVKYYPLMVWGSWGLYMGIMPVYDYFVNSKTYCLPLPLWFPFDTTHPIGFLAGYIFELLSVNGVCVQVITGVPTFVYVTTTIFSEYNVLINSLRTLHVDALSTYKTKFKHSDPIPSGNELYADPEFLFCLRKHFKEIVEHHQSILRCITSFQRMVCVALTMILSMGSLIIACATVFIYIGNSSVKIIFGGLLVVNLFILGVLCYLGEQIHSQGEKVREELYFTNWYDWPEDMKRTLRIMLARTLKPPKLCGAFITVTPNYDTLATVLNGAYSLVNLLIAFKTDLQVSPHSSQGPEL